MNKLFVSMVVVLFVSCNTGIVVPVIPDGLINIDGNQNEDIWPSAYTTSSFTNPWNKSISPKTSFSIAKDSGHLYFYFNARDNEILFQSPFIKERDVEKEDRVELFFSKDLKMSEYYCFEMDAKGRTLSYAAAYYRQFDFEWNPPDGFHIAATIYPGGYSVEGSIPVKFLHNISHNHELYFGAYRADFKRKDSAIIENWLTLKDPRTRIPDFHVPSSLMKLILNR